MKIFERFYRQAEDGTGSGLGLAIVRIALRHGGDVDAAISSALGGLRVRIRLPARGPGGAQAAASDPLCVRTAAGDVALSRQADADAKNRGRARTTGPNSGNLTASRYAVRMRPLHGSRR